MSPARFEPGEVMSHRRGAGKGAMPARARLSCAVLLAGATFLLGQGRAQATAKSWNVVSGNWNVAGNWSPSGVPGTLDDVTISTGTVTVNANASVKSLSIAGGAVTVSGSTTTIATTGAFALSGGTFTSGSASANTITVGGSLAVSSANPSLVGYWKLDETSSPSADSSTTNASLTWSGSPTTSTSVPSTVTFADTRSLSLTGSQYAASTALNPNWPALRPATVTMSAWYKATSVDTNGAEIVSGGNIYALRLTSTGLSVIKRIAHNASPSQDWVEYKVAPTGFLDGNWHQIVGVVGVDHAMSAYFDGAAISGTYYYNGTGGLNAVSSPPELSALDYGSVGSYGFNVGRNPSTGTYDFGAGCAAGACAIDDVRIYNRALSAGEISALASGSHAGILTLSSPLSITGSLTVQSSGTLTLSDANATITMASGQSLTMDGVLNSSTSTSSAPTIKSAAGSYAFKVGSTSTATPTLNIAGLKVQNTDANGMYINAVAGSATTFTRFDNIAFSNGTNTSTGVLLQIYSTGLFLTSNGCSFDAGIAATTKYTVKLTGNGYTGTPDTTQTRALFGGATCSTSYASCQASKSDDDSNSDGLPSTSASNGAVVQFVRAAMADTAGTAVGLPVTAFDWNDYSYYSTYFAYNTASGTSSSVYVRNGSGAAQYSWTSPGADTIVGTPRATTAGTKHYLYIATSSGKVYQLLDTGSALTTVGAAWSTNPYDCSCTIVTPLAMDSTNLYWGGTQSGNKLWTLGQSSEAQPMGSPFSLTPTVTTASPAVWINNSTTYAFLGTVGHILKLNVSNQTLDGDNSNPGSASVGGRIALGTNGANRIFAGGNGGVFWAIDPASFAGTQKIWSYVVAGDAIQSSPYYHYATNTVHFGTEGGKVVALDSTGTPLTGYPYQVATASDPIRAAVFYWSGVLVVGTQTGKLFFIDRNNGSGRTLLSQYFFGPNQVISGIGYDNNVNRYMVSVADPSANDGRIYYFDLVPNLTQDPTPAFQ